MGVAHIFLPFFVGVASVNAQDAIGSKESTSPLAWTFLVYMAADNELEEYALDDIREMESTIPESGVRIIVQLDRRKKMGSDRIEIQRAQPYDRSDARPFYSPILETLPEQDTAGGQNLNDFLSLGTARSPSDRLAVIIWGHGSGWQKTGAEPYRAVAKDDSSGRDLSNEELRQALVQFSAMRDSRSIDLLVFDSCLMNMAETLYAMMGASRFFIGSEEQVPPDGLPYDDILEDFAKLDDRSSESVGKMISKKYAESYNYGSQGNRAVEISLVNLDFVGELRDRLDAWVWHVLHSTSLSPEDLRTQAEQTQTFHSSTSRDLWNFVARVRDYAATKSKSSEAFVSATNELDMTYHLMVRAIFRNGSRYRNATGTAIYVPINDDGESSWSVPTNTETKEYRQTPFGRESHWVDLLDYMYP